MNLEFAANAGANSKGSCCISPINGQLGRREEARKHLERFIELAPDVARNIRAEHSKWYSEDLVELRLEGLRKAGLDVDGGGGLISK